MRHIGIFDKQGWEIICTLACPGDLRECPIVQAARDLTGPPNGRVGRFTVSAKTTKIGHSLTLGEEVDRDERAHFSRRTGYSYKRSGVLPKGAE